MKLGRQITQIEQIFSHNEVFSDNLFIGGANKTENWFTLISVNEQENSISQFQNYMTGTTKHSSVFTKILDTSYLCDASEEFDPLFWYISVALENLIMSAAAHQQTKCRIALSFIAELRHHFVGFSSLWKKASSRLSACQSDFASFTSQRVESQILLPKKFDETINVICDLYKVDYVVIVLANLDLSFFPTRHIENLQRILSYSNKLKILSLV